MTEETRLEVIKALAYGESIEDVADFADVTEEEIINVQNEYASEIEERRKELNESWN